MMTRKTSGQTLMELLVAIGVIATGLFTAADLALSNVRLSDNDADQIVATNLAREGIELAKERRDSNWLAGRVFDDGFFNGNDRTAIPLWNGDASTQEVVFDFTPNDMQNKGTVVIRSTASETDGFLQQENVNGDATVWQRLLTFMPLCINQNGDLLVQAPNAKSCSPHVGVRVESRVEWIRKGRALSKVLYDDLFDWK